MFNGGFAMQLEPKFTAMAIGSVPFLDPQEAVDLALTYFSDVPFWPQLPKISIKEQMTAQYSEGLPRINFNLEKKNVYFDTSGDPSKECNEFDALYKASMGPGTGSGDCSQLAISDEYSRGIYALERKLKSRPEKLQYVKVQTVGPCSFALTVTDENGNRIYNNKTFRDIITKAVAMKCRWQIQKFSPFAETVICFLDEPVLALFESSAYSSVSRADVISLLSEPIEAIHASKAVAGIHCCGGTQWDMLIDSGADIISFDAYGFGHTISKYSDAIAAFLQRGGSLAWGIVPTSNRIRSETVESLQEKLETAMDILVSKGIDRELVCEQAIITPSCGAGAMHPDDAFKVFEITSQLSDTMKEKYEF